MQPARTRSGLSLLLCALLPGPFLCLLALVSQLALGAVVLPDDTAGRQRADLAALSIQCSSSSPREPIHHHHHHRAGEPALCPLATALALPAVILMPAPVLPTVGSSLALRWLATASARGPPSAVARPGLPRGPPEPA